MSYFRVAPRDLFNEANLLKCFGKLYVEMENIGVEDQFLYDSEYYKITMNEDDGSLMIQNIIIRDKNGDEVILFRPLNSRDPYPLMFKNGEDENQVFNEDGSLTSSFKEILK